MCESHNFNEIPALMEGADAFEAMLLFLDEHAAISSMIQSTSETSLIGELSDDSVDDSPKKCEPEQRSPQQARVVIHSGKRWRQELMALREEAAVLEKRLKKLKTQPDSAASSTTSLSWFHIQAWQAITEAQHKRRVAAEKERERLRELIKEQMLAAQGIYRYMSNHASNAELVASTLDGWSDETMPAKSLLF